MSDACQAIRTEGAWDGILLMLFFGLPVVFALLYAVFRGLSIASRAERAYQRALGRRAADFMKLGVGPSDAWDMARTEMYREAQAALNV